MTLPGHVGKVTRCAACLVEAFQGPGRFLGEASGEGSRSGGVGLGLHVIELRQRLWPR